MEQCLGPLEKNRLKNQKTTDPLPLGLVGQLSSSCYDPTLRMREASDSQGHFRHEALTDRRIRCSYRSG